jgi:alpha-L-fucosidase
MDYTRKLTWPAKPKLTNNATMLLMVFHAVTLSLAPATEPKPYASKPEAKKPAESSLSPDARMAWWREARFGMFIHWGLYAEAGGVWEGRAVPGLGEWLMNRERVPVAGYAALAGRFQPAGFDAAAWVRAAREAGMKYIVITAKHHDGFAMFRSKASAFNIYDATPFRRDPLKELAAECKKQGMKLGFFYSQAQDWHHAGGATFGEHWDKAQDGDMTAYLKKVAVPQVKELLSNYGPVAVLWWDTAKDMTPERVGNRGSLLEFRSFSSAFHWPAAS